jgi:membrane protein
MPPVEDYSNRRQFRGDLSDGLGILAMLESTTKSMVAGTLTNQNNSRWRFAWSVVQQTLTRWTRNDGSQLAAATAYYAAFSFFPLLLVLISGLGFTLRLSENAQDARQQLLDFIAQRTAPELAASVETLLSGIQTQAVISGLTGWVILAIGAIGIFSQLESAFDRLFQQVTPHRRGVWPAIRNALWNRLKAFLSLVGLGLLVLVAFVVDVLLTAMQDRVEEIVQGSVVWANVRLMTIVTLNAMVFSLIYKLLPRPYVRWTHALCGGLLVAVLWQIGSQIVARFVVGSHYTAYGVVGSFVAMMLWVYCASTLLYLGAQFVQVFGHPTEPPQRIVN